MRAFLWRLLCPLMYRRDFLHESMMAKGCHKTGPFALRIEDLPEVACRR